MNQLVGLLIEARPDAWVGLFAKDWPLPYRQCACARRMGTAWPEQFAYCYHCVYQNDIVWWADVRHLAPWLTFEDELVMLWNKPLTVQFDYHWEEGIEAFGRFQQDLIDWMKDKYHVEGVSASDVLSRKQHLLAPIVRVHVPLRRGIIELFIEPIAYLRR